MYYHYMDLHQAVKSKKPDDNKTARALRAMKEVEDREEEYHDPKSPKNTFKRETKSASACVKFTSKA